MYPVCVCVQKRSEVFTAIITIIIIIIIIMLIIIYIF